MNTPALDPLALASENEELLSFLYMCPIGILKLDAAGSVQILNPQAAQLLMPVVPAATIGNLLDVFQDAAPELRNMVDGFVEPTGHICENHRVFLRPHRQGPRVFSITLLKVDRNCIMALLSDVTKQVDQESRLRQTESWFAALLAGVRDFALFSLDTKGCINGWSASALRQTGFTEAETAGRTMHCFYHQHDDRQGRAAEQVDCARREGWHLDEGWCLRRDGSRFWGQILVAATENEDGEINGFSVVLRDTTERRITSEELRRLLTTDYLTGATNRAHFGELGEREISRYQRYGRALSAIMLDIDHFKRVNDTFGHAVGDQVLRALVVSCRAELRGIDVLARLGGEEFVVLLPGTALKDAAELANRLRSRVERDLADVDGKPVRATISLGCATLTDGADKLDGLLDLADRALYQAKRLGRNRVEISEPGRSEMDCMSAAAVLPVGGVC